MFKFKKCRLLFVGIMTLGLFPIMGNAIDCTLARSKIDQKICSSEDIKKLDVELNEIYGDLFAASETKEKKQDLKVLQTRWIKDRNTCGQDSLGVICLTSKYKERISEIKKQLYSPKFKSDPQKTLQKKINVESVKKEWSALGPNRFAAKSNTEKLGGKAKAVIGNFVSNSKILDDMNGPYFRSLSASKTISNDPYEILLVTSWDNSGLYEQEEKNLLFVIKGKSGEDARMIFEPLQLTDTSCREVSEHLIENIQIFDDKLSFDQKTGGTCSPSPIAGIQASTTRWLCEFANGLNCEVSLPITGKSWCLTPDGNCQTDE